MQKASSLEGSLTALDAGNSSTGGSGSEARAKAVRQLSGALPRSLPSERSAWKVMAAIAHGPKTLCPLPAVADSWLSSAGSSP